MCNSLVFSWIFHIMHVVGFYQKTYSSIAPHDGALKVT